MSHESRTIAKADASVESALASIRSEDLASRGRGSSGSCFAGWLTSAVLHLALLLAISIALMPRDLGKPAVLTVEWSSEYEEMPLEPFLASDEEAVELATTTAAAEDPVEKPDAAIELSFLPAGGLPGGRSTGWRSRSAAGGENAGGRSGPRAAFYGTVAYGNRFVYVLDKSGSMRNGEQYGPSGLGRYERACAELLRSIDRLSDDQWFYVILFSHETQRMFDDHSVFPQMVPATAENKAKLKAWLEQVNVDGNTDPREALRLGLAMKPSAVFLLSDGEFNWKDHPERAGVFVGDAEISDIVGRNNEADAPIHTFAFEDPASRNQLISVAVQTGGEHRDITPYWMTDEEFAEAVRRAEATEADRQRRAESLLQLARSLETEGRKDMAARRYRDIVSQFPSTSAAREAGELLDSEP
jgi:hypothetical protein